MGKYALLMLFNSDLQFVIAVCCLSCNFIPTYSVRKFHFFYVQINIKSQNRAYKYSLKNVLITLCAQNTSKLCIQNCIQ